MPNKDYAMNYKMYLYVSGLCYDVLLWIFSDDDDDDDDDNNKQQQQQQQTKWQNKLHYFLQGFFQIERFERPCFLLI